MIRTNQQAKIGRERILSGVLEMTEYCKLHKAKHTLIFSIMRVWETMEQGENLEMRIECEDDMDIYAEFTLPAYYCHHAYGFMPVFQQNIL